MAPPFPYPSDHWLGQPSDDPRNHSGFYGGVDTTNVRTWQQRMSDRGWSIGVDGMYGSESESVCRSFQAEKGLDVDGDVGPKTWAATWDAPVTNGGGGGSSSSGGGAPPPAEATGSTSRDKALKWASSHLGLYEDPAGSNCDSRSDGIRALQDRCVAMGSSGTWLRGEPWCGAFCASAMQAGGVRDLSYNLASVAWCEDRAKAKAGPFTGYTTDGTKARPGDLVIMFGYGGHVGMVRSTPTSDSLSTVEGNTSDTSANRTRSRSSDVRGYCLVAYP